MRTLRSLSSLVLVTAALVCALASTTNAVAEEDTHPQARAKVGAFVWSGLLKQPVAYLGVDGVFHLTQRLYVPVGYAQYSGALDTAAIGNDSLDVGIEYRSFTM